jgi:hypothetical protein
MLIAATNQRSRASKRQQASARRRWKRTLAPARVRLSSGNEIPVNSVDSVLCNSLNFLGSNLEARTARFLVRSDPRSL